ncbi:hypothetical protein A2U01_0106265, partial [Trifolium medium]|nr:hypothetical protein [Trifolium medium]
ARWASKRERKRWTI